LRATIDALRKNASAVGLVLQGQTAPVVSQARELLNEIRLAVGEFSSKGHGYKNIAEMSRAYLRMRQWRAVFELNKIIKESVI
jgi:hypothetical protein